MGKRFKVLLTYAHPRAAVLKEILDDIADVVVKEVSGEKLVEEIKGGYDALITDLLVPVNAEVLDAGAPRLKVVATLSIGIDHIDVKHAAELGVKVLNAATQLIGASTYAVAEHAFALLLTLVKKTDLLRRLWSSEQIDWWGLGGSPSSPFMGVELFGKALGIVGVGRIGSHVGRIGKGFGMKVVGYDPYADAERAWEDGVELVSDLTPLLSSSDFIVIAAQLTPETRRLIGREEILRMKKGVYVVNVSRGCIIDEEALVEALKDGHVAGYGTDVPCVEPPTPETSVLLNEYLRGELNIVITPHSAWLTPRAMDRYAMIVGRRVREHLLGIRMCEADYLKPPGDRATCPEDVVISKGG